MILFWAEAIFASISKFGNFFRFSAEAILASSGSKFGIRIPLTGHEDLKSSTESTNSTSLIHCIASVGNSRCWSAPQVFEESPSLGMTELLLDGPDWHL